MVNAAGPIASGVSIPDAIVKTVTDVLTHKRFDKCNVQKDRKFAHMLVFFSFIGLAITTTWAVTYLYGPGAMKLLGSAELGMLEFIRWSV